MRGGAREGRPFLGICVGMQLMAERGREFETVEGLGWIAGEVVALAPGDPALKIPHMGWNELIAAPARIRCSTGIGTGAHAYFVHTYHFAAGRPRPIWSPRSIMAGRSPPWSAATISSARSSIPRRAR